MNEEKRLINLERSKKRYWANRDAILARQKERYEKARRRILVWRDRRKRRLLREPWWVYLRSAKRRCTDTKLVSYKYYGAKGVTCTLTLEEVKTLWFRDKAHELKKPSIDRKDTKKGYSFENCRFIELADNVRGGGNWNRIRKQVRDL